MTKKKFQFPINYILIGFIVILLIFLRQMDQRVTVLENQIVTVEKVDVVKKEEKAHKISPEVPPPTMKGKIAIIIDDFGYRNDDVSDGFLALNAKLTYAIIPGHEHSKSFGEMAVKKGFEVIVHMPLENLANKGGEDSFVLTTSMKSETIQERVRTALNQIPMAIGMNNHQGSKASADQHVMSNVARVIKERKLFFVDSRTTAETVAESTMEVFNVPTTHRNVFLDNVDDEGKILAQLIELVEKSDKWGSAVGIGHVKPNTLKILKEHIPILQRKGYQFEFVSNMLH